MELLEQNQLQVVKQAGILEVMNTAPSSHKFMSDDIAKIALALSKAQGILENATKDKKGHNGTYATLSSCLDALKKPFSENGLAISQLINVIDGDFTLITLLIHESGQWLKSIFPIKGEAKTGMNGMQALGSSISYGRRYSLCGISGLGAEDDDGAGSKADYSRKKTTEETPPPPQSTNVAPEILELKKRCTEKGYSLVEFTKFNDIHSDDILTVKSALAAWDSYCFSFENRFEEKK